jgi:hypothetical protein
MVLGLFEVVADFLTLMDILKPKPMEECGDIAVD